MCALFLSILLKTAAIKEQTFGPFWGCDFQLQNVPVNMTFKQCFQSLG